jgi:hypothetical protein
MSLTEITQHLFLRSAAKFFAESLDCGLDDQ